MKASSEMRREGWLVLRAQLGDRGALDELLRGSQTRLHGYLRRLIHDGHAADDLLQEVFVLICRNLRFLREASVFRAWTYRIASRAAMRFLKRRARGRLVETSVDAERLGAAEPVRLDEARLAELGEKLSEISPNTRAVLVLHYFEGLTVRETADVLDLAVGTVKSRLAYGLKRLRDTMTDEVTG